jgi:hypothetical protein
LREDYRIIIARTGISFLRKYGSKDAPVTFMKVMPITQNDSTICPKKKREKERPKPKPLANNFLF